MTKEKKKLSKKEKALTIIIFVILGILIGTCSKETKEETIILPSDEVVFIDIVSEAQNKSSNADNDMQRGGIIAERNDKLCSLMTNLEIQEWIGKVDTVDANSDGKGILSIEIANDIYLKTWNNAFSDIGSNTLIDPSSSLFATASTFKSNQKIKFSGIFISDNEKNGCIKESSITLNGKLREPEFIFRFSSVEAL